MSDPTDFLRDMLKKKRGEPPFDVDPRPQNNIIVRNIFTGVISVMAVWLLLIGLNTGELTAFLQSAFVTALAMYTFFGARYLPKPRFTRGNFLVGAVVALFIAFMHFTTQQTGATAFFVVIFPFAFFLFGYVDI